ncbi:MAG TPA: hypothetical protein VG838_08270 [Opitutaceae bacterium]|nr:hypothetical protein [Opitutaceae bacterium]
MTKSRDPLALGPHWHVDCRLETELPEDNVVGKRFLINALFGSATLALILFTGWLAYMNLSLHSQIRDWDQRITESRKEVQEIQKLQRDYLVEAKKVDHAYALMKSSFFISGFTAHLGQTLPRQLNVDSIDSSETAIMVRGSIHESYETASDLLSGYRKQLLKEPEIAPFFDKINTDLVRAPDNTISFEITFQRKPPPA